ncbi:MAG: RNA 2',3'-cyclic phosphodiesterase [Candidatus Auribacter fodinae]|jgi:2'-5' RNA ligase|uniref:RNA 2',3'-cyclic phosphodiesterase n=1 Tax=Candidatus Auribacter fodinae TaxID=2093366 RepID=A0A3A4R161_9BACT|nr:MAG: RNA 2',3'-cyclic phosphodiesterase [Candidatus Auribacter fodinae]
MSKNSNKSDESEIRLFIAFCLSADILNAIDHFISNNQSLHGIRWVKTENIHLTLKFLGNIAIKRVPKICKALDSLASEFSPFSIAITGVGCFPNQKKPRVIWAGVDKNAPLTEKIASKLDAILHEIGFEKEQRPFQPHITIGRVKDPKEFSATSHFNSMIQKAQNAKFGECEMTKISLIQSILRPEGPVYTEIHSSHL